MYVLDPQGVECTGPLHPLVMVFKRDGESRIAVFVVIVQRRFKNNCPATVLVVLLLAFVIVLLCSKKIKENCPATVLVVLAFGILLLYV